MPDAAAPDQLIERVDASSIEAILPHRLRFDTAWIPYSYPLSTKGEQ